MTSTTIGDPFNSWRGRGDSRGGRGGGRGGAPGRGRGRGKADQNEQNSGLDVINKTTSVGRGKGAGFNGFIPTPADTASAGRGESGQIGQSANRGFAPRGRGRGISPPPEGVAPSYNSAQGSIPSPIDTQGDSGNYYGGQNRGGRGGRARGRWFKSANGDRGFDNADARSEASDGPASRGGRGWRGGYTPRGCFRGRGRGEFDGQDRGGRGRGRGQTWRGRGGASDRAYGERYVALEPVVDNLPPPRDMRENIVGPAIVELAAPDVAVVDKPTKIQDLRCIGSYTWDKKRKRSLIVPGSTRVWVDRELPFQVAFDSGIRMFHEDAFYMANQSTLIPLFRAVDTMALGTESGLNTGENVEAIDWAAVDFVTDRNNLRKLLRWVREPGPTKIQMSSPVSETAPLSPASDGISEKQGSDFTAEWDPRKDFRIDLQLGGVNTVLMERWAARAREVISPPKGGCRSNFEQEHTMAAQGCENGGGHYRIVQYSIGGLNMVVRFEVDACIPETTGAAAGKRPEPNGWTEDIAEPGDTERDIAARENTESPARQSFIGNEEGESRAKNQSTPEISTPSKVKPKKQEDEEVDLDKEAALWAGGDDDSWGALPAPPRSVKGERAGRELREDARSQAPPPQDLSWDLPEDDGSAWGAAPDTTQDEDVDASGELTVIRSGTLLPQSSILELATRSIRYADRTSNEDVFLQLFLTQTPTHVIAIHQNGNFEKIVRQELESTEFSGIAEMEGIQKSIAGFVELLKNIQRLVKEHGTTGRLSFVCEKGRLELFGLGGEEGGLSDVELERFKSSA